MLNRLEKLTSRFANSPCSALNDENAAFDGTGYAAKQRPRQAPRRQRPARQPGLTRSQCLLGSLTGPVPIGREAFARGWDSVVMAAPIT
ncbi:hypothetical protein EV184_10658 [Sinorhizobium americanum]|uniref:Uncharacterized protein n=1 Tax=Sinorhizobium americanum TaxID=194963 RepID=A0A4R2BUQ5_9HYPH|nr:hypothetical protein EV184_10658 [Sinorhizobium americanum]